MGGDSVVGPSRPGDWTVFQRMGFRVFMKINCFCYSGKGVARAIHRRMFVEGLASTGEVRRSIVLTSRASEWVDGYR